MADTTDQGYDEATNRNDGRGTIPDGVEPPSAQPEDINSRDNEAQWSREE